MKISSHEKRGLTLKFLKSYKILNSNLENILSCRFEYIKPSCILFYDVSIISRPLQDVLGCPYFRPCPRFRPTSRDGILDIFKD